MSDDQPISPFGFMDELLMKANSAKRKAPAQPMSADCTAAIPEQRWIAVKRNPHLEEDPVWQVVIDNFVFDHGTKMVHNFCSEERARLIASAPELKAKLAAAEARCRELQQQVKNYQFSDDLDLTEAVKEKTATLQAENRRLREALLRQHRSSFIVRWLKPQSQGKQP